MKRFASPPKFLGSDIAVSTTSSGARVAIDPSTGQTVDVVLANAKDLATLHFADLQEGVYVVGSGSTGVAATMMTFGAVYFSVLAAASMMYRVAPSGFAPAGWKRPVLASGAVQTYVPVENVMKTPQFWMGFTMLGCLATSGLAGWVENFSVEEHPLLLLTCFLFSSCKCGQDLDAGHFSSWFASSCNGRLCEWICDVPFHCQLVR
jgi:hypothetical protein